MRRRLYIFPALLPLAEILPFVLTGLGFLAGAVGALWRRARILVALSGFLIVAGLAIWWQHRPSAALVAAGTQTVPAIQHPVPKAAQETAPPIASAQMEFQLLWSVPTEAQVLSSPIAHNGVIVWGTYSDTVEARSLTDGALKWTLPLGNPVFSMGLSGDVAYAGEGLHHTISATHTAMHLPDGQVLWQREFLGHLEAPPEFDEKTGRMFTSAGPGGIWALNMADGTPLWQARIGHTDSTPLLYEGKIFAQAQPDESVMKSYFYMLDAQNGDLINRITLPGQPWGRPQVSPDGKVIYTSSGMGQIGVTKPTDKGWVIALDMQGETVWKKELENMQIEPGSYMPDEGLIIHTLKSGVITAVHTENGAVAWRAEAGSEFMAPATLIRRLGKPPVLAALSVDGVFTVRHALTGNELARQQLEQNASASPVYAEGVLYVLSAYRLYAFGGVGAL
ncbi:MAG: PQQ-binding-like beta-propeller repeat protein [Alphaproteobacteria bacterium]|nr:PQQ-binding-like beta-propeller repeat protein [Alphaproteobacteria bacterium]